MKAAGFLPSFQKSSSKHASMMFEISVIYSLVLAFILLVFSGVVYYILSETLYAELDNEVELKAEEISANIRTYLEVKGTEPATLGFAIEKTITSADAPLRRWWYIGFERSWFERLDEQDIRNDYINFLAPDGSSMIHSKNVEGPLLDLLGSYGKLHNGQKWLYYLKHNNHTLRVINYPFENTGQAYILQVGISMHPVIQLLQGWMNHVFLSIPIILLLTSFIGRVLASRILKPVRKISFAANAISDEDLSKRVEKENYYEEMDSLIDAFNNMIDRLEKSFSHIQNFSSHIAHELKTPLTIMRGETEVALMGKRSNEDYKQALNIVLNEITKMLKIIEDLLFLTKMDHQPGVLKFERLNFLEYFQEIYEQSRLLAVSKEIRVALDVLPGSRVFVKADPLHLRRLFFNLLDNAIKYSPAQSRIHIRVTHSGDRVAVSIEDQGAGIPPDEIGRIFERFYTANHHQSGSGLGLSIAQSIANAHGGHIEVKSRPDHGSTFTVTLPAA